MKKHWAIWKGRTNGRLSPRVHGLVTEDVFKHHLQRECALADRNGHGFSLLLFQMDGENELQTYAQQLAKVLQQRLRRTDVECGRILHPSPASPVANRGWAAQATKELQALGVEVP